MKCVKVCLKQAEVVKRQLFDLGVFSRGYCVVSDKNHVYFPVNKAIKGFNIVDKKLKKKKTKLSLNDALGDKLDKNEFDLLCRSYEVIGNIAILEIDENLLKKKKIVAKALLDVNKNIKTVVRKIGGHEGEYRIRNYEFLGGVKNFETLHKESGINFKLDIRKTYFSARLSSERLRIARSVKNREEVLVMFSGVGVYPLVISKFSKADIVYGVEINPDSCKYAEENVKINFVKNVKLFCGDVKDIIPKLNKKFDRVIMPLPKTAISFLDLTLGSLKSNGIVNLYCFSQEDKIDETIEILKKKCKCKILKIVKCGQQGPRIYRYCIDFMVL